MASTEVMLVWTGRVTLERWLEPTDEGDRIEMNIAGDLVGHGPLEGFRGYGVATYESILRPDGTRRGTGGAIVRGEKGEVVTVHGEGRARVVDGKIEYRTVHTFGSRTPGLEWLNATVGVSEYEQDENGDFVFTISRWV